MAAHGDVPRRRVVRARPRGRAPGCFGVPRVVRPPQRRRRRPRSTRATRSSQRRRRAGGGAPRGRRASRGTTPGRGPRRARSRASSRAREPRLARRAPRRVRLPASGAPSEARDAIDAASGARAAGRWRSSSAAAGCRCSSPATRAGSRSKRATSARAMAHYERVWVADAGCALALERALPRARASRSARGRDARRARRAGARRRSPRSRRRSTARPVRWHDPCQLGRGLGVYEAPRAVLDARARPRARRVRGRGARRALCSGAGGLLPVDDARDVARAIADARLAAHERAGRRPRRDGVRLEPHRAAAPRRGVGRRRGRPGHLDRARGAPRGTLAHVVSPSNPARQAPLDHRAPRPRVVRGHRGRVRGDPRLGHRRAAARRRRQRRARAAGTCPVAHAARAAPRGADHAVDARRRHPRRARARLDARRCSRRWSARGARCSSRRAPR